MCYSGISLKKIDDLRVWMLVSAHQFRSIGMRGNHFVLNIIFLYVMINSSYCSFQKIVCDNLFTSRNFLSIPN